MYFAYYANFAQRPKYRDCLSNSWPVYYVEIRSYDIQSFFYVWIKTWEKNTKFDFVCNSCD